MGKTTKAYFDPDIADRVASNAASWDMQNYTVMSIYRDKNGGFFPVNVTEKDTDVAPGRNASLTTRDLEKSKLYMELPAKLWKGLSDDQDKFLMLTRDGGLQVATRITEQFAGMDVQSAIAMGVTAFDDKGKKIAPVKNTIQKLSM